ncbi:MAG: cob(I)yrinic acid a,c-diamide adenosyltransferase [Candidatus Neomarinimicrobiota bacterium]|nr:MAG: cob(I)yrinic acid a,c-diamide adenosyltransferase [Candidatus Neomarinimicrobiota bacterium]
MRISKVTTKKGDQGTTELADGTRRPKSDPLFEGLGTLDELSAVLGWARAAAPTADIRDALEAVQQDLFDLGGEIALGSKPAPLLKADRIDQLETEIQSWNSHLPPLQEFLLPGGTEFQGRLHLARAICRRAERRLIPLASDRSPTPLWIPYLNRLSDWLFVAARYFAPPDTRETQWRRGSGSK